MPTHVLHPPTPLPKKIKEQSAHADFIKKASQLCLAACKRNMIKMLTATETPDLADEITTIAEFIWQNGYSRGTKDSDRMHQILDKSP